MTPLTDAHTHRIPREPDQNALVNLNWNFLPESRPAGVYFSLGIHPKDADSISLEQLKNAVRQTPCSAIGECGLDPLAPVRMEKQRTVFRQQIELAQELALPMVIHCVRLHYEIIHFHKQYWKHPEIPWLVHGFRGKPETAMALRKAGCLLSLSPVWLMHLHRFPEKLSGTDFLLETDESKIPLPDIYRRTAELRNETPEELSAILNRNFRTLLNLNG